MHPNMQNLSRFMALPAWSDGPGQSRAGAAWPAPLGLRGPVVLRGLSCVSCAAWAAWPAAGAGSLAHGSALDWRSRNGTTGREAAHRRPVWSRAVTVISPAARVLGIGGIAALSLNPAIVTQLTVGEAYGSAQSRSRNDLVALGS